jgi:hypothetical protein
VDLFDRLPDTTDPDALYDAFTGWTSGGGSGSTRPRRRR